MTFVLIRVLLQPHSVRPLQGEVAAAAGEGGVAAGGVIPSVGNLELELELFLKSVRKLFICLCLARQHAFVRSLDGGYGEGRVERG